MKLQALGIDLAKNVFHLVGLDSSGQVVIRKRCSRRQVLAFTANVQVGVIGMEACGGAHFLGRALREQGYEVRLMPAQYVKPPATAGEATTPRTRACSRPEIDEGSAGATLGKSLG
jgi:transposase